jgi:hypothetical protein
VKRTNPLNLALLGAFGAVGAWFAQTALVASGRPATIPPLTLAFALVAIAVIIVAMALPVRRVTRRVAGARIDPFYATRVVTLAKASSLGGALLGGAGLGILAFLLTRSVVPGLGSITAAIAAAVGALVLLIAGLVAEHMCTLPPDDDEPPQRNPRLQGIP